MNCLESIRMWDSNLYPTPTQVSVGRGASEPDLPATQ